MAKNIQKKIFRIPESNSCYGKGREGVTLESHLFSEAILGSPICLIVQNHSFWFRYEWSFAQWKVKVSCLLSTCLTFRVWQLSLICAFCFTFSNTYYIVLHRHKNIDSWTPHLTICKSLLQSGKSSSRWTSICCQ